ncbi:MAG: UbiD family decarboxylase [Candidatus Tectomicrobia bacterium]|nr:UbiD family decarboxylase [Candidatus Tectomicrobia bacterium]
MAQDLRDFLAQLEARYPDDLLRIEREVSAKHEISAFIRKLDLAGRHNAVLFENVRGYDFPVIANLLADKRKYALALNLPEASLSEAIADRMGEKIPPVVLDPKRAREAPVHEVVWTGDDADLTRLPIVTHSARDDAPYITMGVTVSVHPETGHRDIGIFRHRLLGKDRVGIYYSWGKHLQYAHRHCEERGESLPVAIVLGMHPAFHVAAVFPSAEGKGEDEYAIVGGLLGEPLELVPCKTIPLQVPAQAEIVIEGEILPGERQREGPFGEFHQYYGQIVDAPVVRVKAVTHRRDAMYQNVGIVVEHLFIQTPLNEGFLLSELRKVVPTVKAVALPNSGVRYVAYVSLEKVNEGDAKNVILATLSSSPYVKLVVVVDPDIDIHNESEVNWAIATRVVADRDIVMIPGARGNRLDPTTYTITRLARDGMVTKMGIDATIPMGLPYEFPQRLTIPGVEEIRIEDYVTPSRVGAGR